MKQINRYEIEALDPVSIVLTLVQSFFCRNTFIIMRGYILNSLSGIHALTKICVGQTRSCFVGCCYLEIPCATSLNTRVCQDTVPNTQRLQVEHLNTERNIFNFEVHF